MLQTLKLILELLKIIPQEKSRREEYEEYENKPFIYFMRTILIVTFLVLVFVAVRLFLQEVK